MLRKTTTHTPIAVFRVAAHLCVRQHGLNTKATRILSLLRRRAIRVQFSRLRLSSVPRISPFTDTDPFVHPEESSNRLSSARGVFPAARFCLLPFAFCLLES